MTGPTVNLVPIVLHVPQQESVAAFLPRVRIQAAEMMPFEHTGISNIRRHIANSHTTGLDFQTLLVVHAADFSKAIGEALDDLGLTYIDEVGKKEQHAYPLILSFTLSSNTIELGMQYDPRVLETRQARNITQHSKQC